MKSFVQSLYLFTNAIGSALNEALVPATGDPEIMWMYTGVGCASIVTGAIVWFIFHHYDDQEEAMNKLSAYDDVSERTGYESDPETGAARNTQQHVPEEKI